MPLLDVARNMAFGLETRTTSRRNEVQQRVEQQSKRLRVGKLLRRMPTQLSTGEQSQVGVGRALVRTPSAFLLDEPLAHIDAHERARMRRVIAETVRASNASTLYVTHDQSMRWPSATGSSCSTPAASPRSRRHGNSTTGRPACSSPTSSARSDRRAAGPGRRVRRGARLPGGLPDPADLATGASRTRRSGRP